ncbi:MAG: aminotransferase class IV [Gaiellaceae bacterium]
MTLLALAVSGRGVVDPGEPVIHADDEAFQRGRAAFETTRVYGGRPFRLEVHLDRLDDSARRLGIPRPDRAELMRLAAAALEQADRPEAILRVYCTPGREGEAKPLALAAVATLPAGLEDLRARGLRLVTGALGSERPGLLAGVKSTSYAFNMAAADEARRAGGDDALFLARRQVVLEGPTSNIWWRRERTLFTPSLELGVLAGVTRGVLLQEAQALGYDVREGAFALDELSGAEEAFTSSSIREVMPVVAVDGAAVGRPGSATRKLQESLRAAARGT